MDSINTTYQKELYKLICRIKDIPPKKISFDEIESFITENISEIEYLISCKESCDERLREMADVIISYSNKDFNKKALVSNSNNEFDGLAVGINMLGEELSSANISLHEKETLLKEIHHRVKNNLQLVSSLINLQSSILIDEEAKIQFKECQDRIKSMALVHEKLYRTENFSQINFSNYAIELVKEISRTYPYHNKIELKFGVEKDIFLDLDTSISVGLILNELVVNSFKHAFKEDSVNPKTQVSIEESNEQVFVQVIDNGLGVPNDFNLENSSSLGFTIITSLIEQLEGDISIHSKNGTKVSFNFKK
jgi:two-component sensor histidine kinase